MYRIRKKYERLPFDNVSLQYPEVFATYEEANAEREKRIAEFQRQLALSDYDWSVEQIDYQLNFWQKNYGISDDDKARVRKFLLAMDNVEDLVVRSYLGSLQWKYDREKKRKSILPETL